MLAIDSGADGRVTMTGRFDSSQTAAAQEALDRTSGTVTLDCAALNYLSSAGLGVLLKTHKRLLGAGGKLRLTGVNGHLLDIFNYSGLSEVFEIEPAGKPAP